MSLEYDINSWRQQGRGLGADSDKNQWAIVDWFAAGEERFHKEAYKVAAEIFPQYKRRTFEDFNYVGRNVPPSVRTEKLPFAYHKLVARFHEKPDYQKELLAFALDQKLRVHPFRKYLNSQHPPIKKAAKPSDTFKITLPSESLAVITDPPYGLGIAEWDKEVPYGFLSEFLRITAGPILWFGSARRLVLDSGEFPKAPQRVLIWAPAFTLGHAHNDCFTYRYHPIYAWNLPNRRTRGPLWCDVLRTHSECGNWWDHPGTKPLALMRDLCQIVPAGSTILDPFAGTGTTCVAAKQNGQHFLGFEFDRQHHSVALERLRCVPTGKEEAA